MKIVHTSDWHAGRVWRQQIDRAWFTRSHGRDADDATLRAFDALLADAAGGAA